ncbi:hypothetical protein WN943_002130 [Citrus x changshan-huyou]
MRLWMDYGYFMGTRAVQISPRVNRHVAVYAFAISFSFGNKGSTLAGCDLVRAITLHTSGISFKVQRYHSSNLSLFGIIMVPLIAAFPLTPLHSLRWTSPVVQNMVTNGGNADVAKVLGEIETLKAAKSDIENRISALEAQLRETNVTQPQNDTVSIVDITRIIKMEMCT